MTIGLLVLASIAIITLDYRGEAHGVITSAKRGAHDAFSPLEHGVDALVRPVGSFLSGAVHGGALEDQNAKLREQIGVLQRQALTTQATHNSLRTLERLDQLPWVGTIPTVAAEVTALGSSDFDATVQLDKGSTSGVAVGMPVVGGAGLIGQVVEVWSSGCTVRLLTDVDSSVGVRFGSAGTLALVQGSGLGRSLAVNLIAAGHLAAQGRGADHERAARRPVSRRHPGGHGHVVHVDALGHPGDGVGPTARRPGRAAVRRRLAVAGLAVTRSDRVGAPGWGPHHRRHGASAPSSSRSLLVVQNTLLDLVRVDGAHPDVMLLLPVAAGYAAGPDRGAVFGFITGLVADLFLPTPFGLSALVGCLLGFGTGVATRGLVRTSWWLPPLVAAAATTAGMGAYAILGAVLGEPGMLKIYLVPALVVGTPSAALLAVPVLRVVAWAVPEPGPGRNAAAGGGLR